MSQFSEIRRLNAEIDLVRDTKSDLKRAIASSHSSQKTLITNRRKVLDSRQRILKIRAQLAAQRAQNIATLETNVEFETAFLESKSSCSKAENSLGQHKATLVMEQDKLKSQR